MSAASLKITRRKSVSRFSSINNRLLSRSRSPLRSWEA